MCCVHRLTTCSLLCVCFVLQSLPCTLESCLASYTLLLDVLSAAGRPVGGVIDHGVGVFEEVQRERPNDRALADHALCMLDYRWGGWSECVCVSVCVCNKCTCMFGALSQHNMLTTLAPSALPCITLSIH